MAFDHVAARVIRSVQESAAVAMASAPLREMLYSGFGGEALHGAGEQ